MLGMEGVGQMKGGFKALMKMLDAIAELQASGQGDTYADIKYRKVQKELKEDGWL